MEPYQDVVIQSQRKLLDDLRGSSLCRHKALLVAIYLFAEHLRQIKEFSALDTGGNDEVPRLDKNTYTFDNYTPSINPFTVCCKTWQPTSTSAGRNS